MSAFDLTVLLLGAAIFAAGLASVWWSRSALARGTSDLGRIQAKSAVLEREVRRAESLRPEGERVTALARRNRTLTPEAAFLAVLTDLPPDVRFTRVRLDYSGLQVSIALDVAARGPLPYERFLNALRRNPAVTSLVPGQEEYAQETHAEVRVLLGPLGATP